MYEYDVSEDIRAEDWNELIVHEECDDEGNFYYYTEYKGERIYKKRTHHLMSIVQGM